MSDSVGFRRGHRWTLLTVLAWLLTLPASGQTPANVLTIDCARVSGEIRPLHGANFGPLCANGTVDLTPFHRALALPSTRLHDIPWTYGEVVDVHAIFRNPAADPADPASYDFRRTDDYLAAVTNTGAAVVFRLGESIEHTPRKYWVQPPADFDRWAEVCAGIVRHYNEGWAGGFRHGIRDWEIWNEPENQPACWTGSDEDYFRLYEVTARKLKQRWPELRVGGPAVGGTGQWRDGAFQPSRFLTNFLARCRERRLPLDFFSWHHYGDDPDEFVRRSRAVRELLDQHGFQHTPSHLNEWNYLPGDDWGPLLPSGQGGRREAMFGAIGGPAGAAFVASTLLRLQDAPVAMANYFSADNQGFGLFTPAGAPRKNYHAFLAFRRLLDTPLRLPVQSAGGAPVECVAGARADRREVGILLSHFADKAATVTLELTGLPWTGGAEVERFRLDAAHDLSGGGTESVKHGRLSVELPPWGVCLLTLRPPP